MSKFRAFLWSACSALLLACSSPAGCSSRSTPVVRVSRNPYANVDWQHDLRLKTAMHDHVRTKPLYLKRMDEAGYDAVPLMHYSGVASLAHPWRERRWPPERYLPPELFAELKHIKLFYPSAEEIGFDHVTSPFLTTYIAKWEAGYYARREPWHYGSTQEAIDVIHAFGGMAFVAHPWDQPSDYYGKLQHFDGMEIYNAYGRQQLLEGKRSDDGTARLLRSWDHVLRHRPEVIGIAVNDWYGAVDRSRPRDLARRRGTAARSSCSRSPRRSPGCARGCRPAR